MKRLERRWFETFTQLSDWLIDEDEADTQVINIQEKNGLWYVYYWEIT